MRFSPLSALLFAAAAFAQIPTPESVLGHKPGDDYFLATYDESLAYFKKLAASTDKLKLIPVGKTTLGVDWYVAVISSPKNLADLQKHKDTARRLALVKGTSEVEARALARDGKLMVHIDGGLHATEVAGAQHTIQLAYNLVTRTDSEVAAILDNVVLVLWFCINPDGQNMVAKWYRGNVGTPYEVSSHPGLYQEYIGHDNNRDGYMNNMIESRVINSHMLDFYPQVVYNHHQTAPFPARIWIPPFAEPISTNPHPLMWRWVNVFGTAMAAYLDEHGQTGAMHRGRFDDWYPGFIDHVNSFRNTVSFLTETALYRYGTPHFYTIDEFPREKQDLRSEMFYASPWRGGWWRLGDAVNMMIGASMAVLDTAAKHREDLLFNRYQAGRDVIERYRKDPPYAYIIPREQRDLPTARILVEKLMLNGIEVSQATRDFTANSGTFKEGSWVVQMDQPFANLVKELFEIQKYPDLRATPTSPPELPYDVTGWTLPMQMGVETVVVSEPVSDETRGRLRKIERVEPIPGKIDGTGPVFAFSHNTNAALKTVNAILDGGGTVHFSKTDGTIYATGGKADQVARTNGVDAKSLKEAPAEVFAVKKPRIAIYEPWAGNIDQGWTRWVLEQFGFDFARVRNYDIQAGHLNDRFDTIVFAEMQTRAIVDGMQPGTVPGQYAGGIGDAGVDALRDFVTNGGTLVLMGNSAAFGIERFNLPITNVLTGLRAEEFFCSGALLRVEVAPHPVTAGLPSETNIMFERNQVFETRPNFRGKILASYPKERNPLRSGYLLGADKIQGKVAALDANVGRGHVIILGFRAQWRGQSHATYKFLFNALYYNPSMAPESPGGGGRGGGGGNPSQAAWRREAETSKNELGKILEQNKLYFSARGPRAAEEGKKLETALDTFQRDRLPALDDLRAAVEDAAVARSFATYTAALRKLAVDMRTRDFTSSTLASLFEQYKLTVVP